MNLLLVDDEKELCNALSAILLKNNYSVDVAYDGETGLDYALSGIYDLIMLDVMLPKMNGFEILKKLRAAKIASPVLMLTARSETRDKIEGLNIGADDYITKPFNMSELLARIKALLRRNKNFTLNSLSFSDIILDRDTVELICGDKKIALGKKEFQILEILMLSAAKCVNKELLIEKIWGYDSEAEYNTIEVYVSFLRKKLAAVNSKTEIRSIRGVGYMLNEK